MEGYIQLHRKMLEWEWYDDINTTRLFIHLLIKANWKDKQWKWKDIPRWSFITSLDKLSFETKLTVQQIRTAFKKLKSTGEVTNEWHTTYTLVKLNKYNDYQKVTSEITNEQQTSNKRVTTTNKEKQEKKEIRVTQNLGSVAWAATKKEKQTKESLSDLQRDQMNQVASAWNAWSKKNRQWMKLQSATPTREKLILKAVQVHWLDSILIWVQNYIKKQEPGTQAKYLLNFNSFFNLSKDNWIESYL